MNISAILVLILGLVFQTGPSCSTAGQPAIASAAMDCSSMNDSDLPMPGNDGKDMAKACHACVSRLAEAPPVIVSLFWKDFVPGMKPQDEIAERASKPPTPPPRRPIFETFQPDHGV